MSNFSLVESFFFNLSVKLLIYLQNIKDLPSSEVAQWADALFLVYSITDRESFNYVRRAKQSLQPEVPLTLVGNKADMVHLRQVTRHQILNKKAAKCESVSP